MLPLKLQYYTEQNMDDIKKLLGRRIKELRVKNKLSQEELAEKIDIAERNLSKIECGVNFIRAEKLGKLADALNVKPKDLFDFDHQQNLSEIKQELISAINESDEKLRLVYQIYKIVY